MGAGEASPVDALSLAFSSSSVNVVKPTTGVIQKQYLCGSEYPIRNNELCENIFCDGGSTGPNHIDIGLRQAEDLWKVRRDGDPCACTTAILGCGRFPSVGLCFLA